MANEFKGLPGGPSGPFNPDPPMMETKPKPGGMPGMGAFPTNVPVPSFNQRRANAMSLYGPGGQGMQMNFGQPSRGTPSMQPMQPPIFQAPMGMGPKEGQPTTRPMEPQVRPPAGPVGGMGAPGVTRPPQMGGGQGGPGSFGPPQQEMGGPSASPDFFRQLFSNPGFMRMLMQYMGQQGGGRGRPGMTGAPGGGMQQPQGGADTPFRRGPVGGGGSGPFNPPMY